MKTKTALLALSAALLVPAALFSGEDTDVSPLVRNLNLNLIAQRDTAAAGQNELRALHKRLAMSTYDLNHDGQLDDQEFAAWEKEVRAVASTSPQALKKYDRNHDGKIDDAEWIVARIELLGAL